MKSNLSGKFGEWIARLFLRLKGYRVIVQNYRSKLGEIDIIAVKKQEICFVEVKTRRIQQDAHYAISPTQLKRIENSARGFLAKNKKYIDYACRFDAVFISFLKFPIHLKNILETK